MYGLAFAWNKGSEDMIEAAIFAEDDDDVLDRRDGGGGVCA